MGRGNDGKKERLHPNQLADDHWDSDNGREGDDREVDVRHDQQSGDTSGNSEYNSLRGVHK